MISTTNKVSGL